MSDKAAAKPERLLTVQDLADRLRLSVACVYTMVSSGQLSCLRVGNGRGSIRFREADVAEYLNGCRSNAPSPCPEISDRALKHISVYRKD